MASHYVRYMYNSDMELQMLAFSGTDVPVTSEPLSYTTNLSQKNTGNHYA